MGLNNDPWTGSYTFISAFYLPMFESANVERVLNITSYDPQENTVDLSKMPDLARVRSP